MLAAISWEWLVRELGTPLVWLGFAGQFIFFMRFAVQWVASERAGRSTVPISFWWISLAGGAITLVYACLKPDLVFMTAQGLALLIYVRNLMLIYRRERRLRVILEQRRERDPRADALIVASRDT